MNWGDYKEAFEFGFEVASVAVLPEGFPTYNEAKEMYNNLKDYIQLKNATKEIENQDEQQEKIDNLKSLREEHKTLKEEISQSKAEYTYSADKQEERKLEVEIDRLEQAEKRIDEIKNLKGNRDPQEELTRFENATGIKAENVSEQLKEIREKLDEVQENLKPMEKNIDELQKSQKENKIEYANQLKDLRDRGDKFEIMDKVNENTKPDKELKDIEQRELGIEYSKTYTRDL